MSGLQRAPAHRSAGPRGKEGTKPARALEIDTVPQPSPDVLSWFSGLFVQVAESRSTRDKGVLRGRNNSMQRSPLPYKERKLGVIHPKVMEKSSTRGMRVCQP